MGGFKNPFGGGNIGTTNQLTQAATLGIASNPAIAGYAGAAGAAGQAAKGFDTSISDPAGMNQYTDLANQAQQEYGNQRAFMDANINPAKKNLITELQARASGKGPSIADAQLKSAFDKSLQSQLAAARSARGANPGLAARNVSNNMAQQQQNIAGQAVVARMQEQNDAQTALQNAITNEQQYATGTLGSALGSQANVALMQNAQRDRNDKRNEGPIGGIIKGAGSFVGLNKGGMMPMPKYAKGGKVEAPKSFAAALKSNKPVKMAFGGQYRADVGDEAVYKFVAGTDKRLKDKGPLESGGPGFTGGGFKEFMAKKMETDDNNALDAMVNEFDAEDADIAQKGIPLADKLKKAASILPMAADGGSADDILEKVKIAAKKLADSKYAKLEEETQYTPHTPFGHRQVIKRLVEGRKRDVASNYADGGTVLDKVKDADAHMTNEKFKKLLKDTSYTPSNPGKDQLTEDQVNTSRKYHQKAGGGHIPGEPVVNGDSERNDTFHAMLSPGEVVIPRSVVADGPVAAAYFTKKATEQDGYNAENYKAERKPFASMLAEIQQSERTYNKVKNIAKKVR